MASIEHSTHRTAAELEARLDHLAAAPTDRGELLLIVRRPVPGERELLDTGELDPEVGLVGDGWAIRGSSTTPDGNAHPRRQLTLMNARMAEFLGGDRDGWAAAGDQLYVDLDLSDANLPAGTRLTVGGAMIEVSEEPHTGCAKFTKRFGLDAMRFVNSPAGRALNLRGINAVVVEGGPIAVGQAVTKT